MSKVPDWVLEARAFGDLTLELERGETYGSDNVALYGHAAYPRSSALAGQSRRVWLESWEDPEEARKQIAAHALKYEDITSTGSTYRPVSEMVAHLEDEA